MIIMSSRHAALQHAIAGFEQVKIPLIGYDGASYFTVYPTGDDVGSYYFIPLLVRWFDISVNQAINSFYLSMAVGSLILGAIGCWFLFRNTLSRLISLLSLPLILSLAYQHGDVYMAFPCVMIAVVPLFLCFLQRHCCGAGFGAFLCCAGILLSTSHYIRGHSDTALMFLMLIGLCFQLQAAWTRKAVLVASLAVGFLLPVPFFSHMMAQRDAFMSSINPDYVPPLPQHPFWHTVYCGLGYLQNSYGLQYLDSVAYGRVAQDAPKAAYISREYEATLKNAVFTLYEQDPAYVVNTVFAKLGVIGYALLRYAGVGLLCLFFLKRDWALHAAFFVALAFNALFGIAAIPTDTYLSALIPLALFYGVFNLATIVEVLDRKQSFLAYFWATSALCAVLSLWVLRGFESLLPVLLVGLASLIVYRCQPSLSRWYNHIASFPRDIAWRRTRQVLLVTAVVLCLVTTRKMHRRFRRSWETSLPASVEVMKQSTDTAARQIPCGYPPEIPS